MTADVVLLVNPKVQSRSLCGKHVVFVVNVDWFFESHRLPIAHALLNSGAEVTVMAAVTDRAQHLESQDLHVVDIPFTRQGRSVRELARVTNALRSAIRQTDPDLVHNVTIKPILTGSAAAASISRRLPVVNAISGFGHMLSDPEAGSIAPLLTRTAYAGALRASRRTAVVVQNEVAREQLLQWHLARPNQVRVIRGMGVDPELFHPSDRPGSERPVVMLASRLIATKGVHEFVQAAGQLRERLPAARFVLVGPTDPGNPLSLTESEVSDLHRATGVEWWGASEDMATTLRAADVFVLPTYHEGLPKVLLEAAATGLPIVTTDIPGCRGVVRDETEALLVPPRTVVPLAEAMERLLEDRSLALRLGHHARERVLQHFTVEHSVEAHLELYRDLVA